MKNKGNRVVFDGRGAPVGKGIKSMRKGLMGTILSGVERGASIAERACKDFADLRPSFERAVAENEPFAHGRMVLFNASCDLGADHLLRKQDVISRLSESENGRATISAFIEDFVFGQIKDGDPVAKAMGEVVRSANSWEPGLRLRLSDGRDYVARRIQKALEFRATRQSKERVLSDAEAMLKAVEALDAVLNAESDDSRKEVVESA